MKGYRVGVDIGGTFTDIVLINEEGRLLTRKVSSSVDDYARAIMEGLAQVFDEAGVEPSEILEVMHGTTVASNAILERKGARVGLIGTDGFRDILEIRNLRMPRLYDLDWIKPPPLIERYLRVVVPERIDAYGRVEKALAREAAEAAVDRLLAEEVEAIAVCLLNSYANPVHERLIAGVIEERAPNLPFCISFDILPEIKEYERTSTTVVNAYVLPIVSRYLASLEENLEAMGIEAPVLLMQSNGGLTPAAEAARKPVNIVESGPAGGVVGAWSVARETGHEDVVSFDMGGTTAKASLIENGVYTRSQEYSVGGGIMLGSRLLTGAGYLLKVPAIDLAEVGAGGGSLVWIDPAGSLRIGPESAGADPGPVCYDAGGDRPTVTDANVILGYLNPDHLCGGEVKLNAGKAPGGVSAGRRRAACPRARPCRLRRAADRRVQHDPRHPRGLDRARPRPAPGGDADVRRQWGAVRGRHGRSARHDAHRGAPPRGALLGVRVALRGYRALLRAHRPDPPRGCRSRGSGEGVRRARGDGSTPARGRRFRRRGDGLRAHGQPSLQGPDFRAHRTAPGRSAERGGTPEARGRLR